MTRFTDLELDIIRAMYEDYYTLAEMAYVVGHSESEVYSVCWLWD